MISWISLGLSIFGACIALVAYRRAFPAVVVGARFSVFIGAEEHVEYEIVVVNDGGSAITITEAGFEASDRTVQRLAIAWDTDLRGLQVDGPTLPLRVDAHDLIRWKIGGSQIERLMPVGVTLRPYAERAAVVGGWKQARRRRVDFGTVRSTEELYRHASLGAEGPMGKVPQRRRWHWLIQQARRVPPIAARRQRAS